ncbi:MAG: putative L-2,4-diaminobutyrate decarboxylase [Bacteroidetes bacterium]|nr:MAG: putative L-2,4-diaminobutyrate decarboxylase [Bacteroidota bacterium]
MSSPKWKTILNDKVRSVYAPPQRDKERDGQLEEFLRHCISMLNQMKHEPGEEKWFWGDINKRKMVSRPNTSGKEIITGIKQEIEIPGQVGDRDDVISQLLERFHGVPNWGHTKTLINVVPQSSELSVAAAMLAAMVNANLVESELSSDIAAVEVEVNSMLAEMFGWNKAKAGGICTVGGTNNYLYATKLALTHCLGYASRYNGIRTDAKIIASKGSHYAKYNCADWTGLGRKNVVEVDVNPDGTMNLDHLEEVMRSLYKQGIPIAMVVATAGTTDAFAIDNIREISGLCRMLHKEFYVDERPLVYADAVIGWAWMSFRNYDFAGNPLQFSTRALKLINDCVMKASGMEDVDMVGVDFHKTGFAAYASSAFCVRDERLFDLLKSPSGGVAYLFNSRKDIYYPGKFTLEVSRSSAPALIAWTHLRYFGYEGYQVMIGHLIEMQQALRDELEFHQNIVVVNGDSYGAVTLFRVYPKWMDAHLQYQNEFYKEKYEEELMKFNQFQSDVYNTLCDMHESDENPSPAISITTKFRQTEYGKPVTALKAYLMGAHTNTDPAYLKREIVEHIQKAVEMVSAQNSSAKSNA